MSCIAQDIAVRGSSVLLGIPCYSHGDTHLLNKLGTSHPLLMRLMKLYKIDDDTVLLWMHLQYLGSFAGDKPQTAVVALQSSDIQAPSPLLLCFTMYSCGLGWLFRSSHHIATFQQQERGRVRY